MGAFISSDCKSAYTVAKDGAVFTWISDNSENKSFSNNSLTLNSEQEGSKQTLQKHAKWSLKSREFLWDPHTSVASVGFHKISNLLVIGFNNGVFGLYEMPGVVNIHRLSVSVNAINTVSINASGEWLVLGSAALGQLLVWEWKSETYVLKQQGHTYGLNALDFSSDGQFICSGGEDGKVKLWSAVSGFCVVTFSEHLAPVTGIKFVGKGAGKAVLSCSLDGTVRARDLLRYRNFRTLTTATPVQFTSVTSDPSGEIVCAGALDPFQIFVWSLQTGRLLEVLSGHEGPIACMDFSPSGPFLASGSWDGTLKIWDVYKNSCEDTFEHGCDVLAVTFRPDGKELCTAATNGQLCIWDVESGTQISAIEGKKDISGGRRNNDVRTAQSSVQSKHFTSVAYSSDGLFVIAGGLSKYTCIYNVASAVLVKKFQLSHNKSLDGMQEMLRSDRLVDGVNLDSLAAGDSDGEQRTAAALLPGAGKTSTGERTTRPEILTSCVRFSPTGREWAAASTQGLQVFALDEAMLFAPVGLDLQATPQAVAAAVNRQQYGAAVAMALQLSLSEQQTLKMAVDAVPVSAIPLAVQALERTAVTELLRFLSIELAQSRHVEFYLTWCWEVLRRYGAAMLLDARGSCQASLSHRQALRSLLRAMAAHEKESMRMCEDNRYSLLFLCSQLREEQDPPASEGDGDVAATDEEERSGTEDQLIVVKGQKRHDSATTEQSEETVSKKKKKKRAGSPVE